MTAVIAAAGSGERLGAGGPKAFVQLAGRPMVEWSLDAFRAAGVEAIVLAVPPGHDYEPTGAVTAAASAAVRVLAGGETRSRSVLNALAAIETDLVSIHDAARPMVTPELISGVLSTLLADPDATGAIAATPVTDTVKRVAASDAEPSAALPVAYAENAALDIEGTLNRAELWAAQTPQVFRAAALREALEAHPDPDAATDEAMLVEAAGGRVLIHPGPAENIKVTTPLDLRLAELLLAERSAQ